MGEKLLRVNSIGGRTLVLVLCVLSMTITGGIVLPGSTAAMDGDAVQRVTVQQHSPSVAQNETPPHRNPDDYSEDGDLESLETWLADRLASQLNESAIQLSEGEYELAEGYVDEEYRERLEQYVDVAGETDGESREDEFEEAATKQEELAENRQEYRETKAEYEEARDAGNEARARELARELERLAAEIDGISHDLQRTYQSVNNATSQDVSSAEDAINRTNSDVQQEQAVIRDLVFVETTLQLEAENDEISFLEPLTATGTLRTANDSTVANESIRLEIDGRSTVVETDANGTFDLEFRPTNTSLSAENVTVRYVPERSSVYLGSETNVSVSITQEEPSVDIHEAPADVTYGDPVRVRGAVHVDDVAVDGVPLEVLVDGAVLGETRATDGQFDDEFELPASVAAGDAELRVRIPFEERALAAADAKTATTVRETETDLAVTAREVDERRLQINGSLEAVTGVGVAAQPVQLRVDGVTATTVTTAEDGSFSETVTVPPSVTSDAVEVDATYRGAGSNLAESDVKATVQLRPTGSEARKGLSSIQTWVWAAVGFGGVTAIGGAIWWYRRRQSPTHERVATPDESETTVETRGPSPAETLLSRASDQLSQGDANAAVQTAYAAVREHLESSVEDAGALTHWEFYRRYRSDGESPTADALEAVTRQYERASFTLEAVSEQDAEAVLDDTRQLCEGDTTRVDGGNTADD